jgi:transposase-like protein
MLSESKFLEIYRRQQESGLSVKDFCANEGIAESTYYYWYKKVRKNSSGPDFIPLVVSPSPVPSPRNYPRGSTSVQDHDADDSVLLEVVYPNGTMLRIRKDLNLEHLRALISLFE